MLNLPFDFWSLLPIAVLGVIFSGYTIPNVTHTHTQTKTKTNTNTQQLMLNLPFDFRSLVPIAVLGGIFSGYASPNVKAVLLNVNTPDTRGR